MHCLKDIAVIRSGFPFRGKVEPVETGGYRLIQIKDLANDVPIRLDALLPFATPEIGPEHRLRAGDVLFVARGSRNVAAAFPGPMTNVVAGSQFFVLRPTGSVMPEYLAWYLNQQAAQRQVTANTSGSYIPFVPKAALENMRVLLPPVEKQKQIVELHKLMVQEQELLEAIKRKREELGRVVLRRVLSNEVASEKVASEFF